jgi:hypothetical protein
MSHCDSYVEKHETELLTKTIRRTECCTCGNSSHEYIKYKNPLWEIKFLYFPRIINKKLYWLKHVKRKFLAKSFHHYKTNMSSHKYYKWDTI